MAMGGINLAPLQTEIRVSLENFRTQMDQVVSTATQAANQASERLSSINKAGEKMSDVGNSLTTHVTAPILALGVAAVKVAGDTEESFAKLRGQLGLTKDETEQLKSVSMNLYEGGFGESIEDCNNTLVVLQQNIKSVADMSNESKQSLAENIMTMNSLFGTTSEELTRTLSVMQNSGLDTDIEHAMDVLTYGFQNGANYSDELLDTMREYSPQFVKLGLSSEQAMNMLIQGAESGAFNLDKVGDAMKEFSIRAIDGSDTTKAGFEAIGLSADEMAQKFASGGDEATTAFQQILVGLAAIDDPVERNIAGVNLFGTMWEDLGPNVVTSLSQAKNSIEGIDGATKKAGEDLNNSFNTKLTSTVRQLKDALLPLGNTLLDMAKSILPSISAGIKGFSDKMNSLTDGQKKAVVAFGAFAAAIGPVLIIVGKLITSAVSIATAWSGISAAFGAASVAAGGTGAALTAIVTGPIAMVIAGVAALALAIATDFGGIRECISSIMTSINTIITAIWTAITNAWNNDLNGIRTITTDVFNIIQTIFSTAFSVISSLFQAFSAAFQGDWSGCWSAVQNIASTIWEAIKSLIGQALNLIVDIILGIAASILNAALTAFNAAKDGASQSWEALKSWFSSAVNDPVGTLQGIGSALYSAGASVFTKILDGFKSAWSSITSWVEEKISWIKSKVTIFNDEKSKMNDGGSSGEDGFNYNGLSYVPFDGYNARLHKGERVLTADENKAYNAGQLSNGGGNGGITLNIENFNNNRKTDVKQLAEELEFYRKK